MESILPRLRRTAPAVGADLRGRAASVVRRLPLPVLESPGDDQQADTGTATTDRATTLQLMEQLSSKARSALGEPSDEPVLPHPLITDRNFSTFLDRASAARTELGGPFGGRARAMTRARALQSRFNDSIIHCLHQLDHRGRQDRARLLELELELSGALARVQQLEARLDRSDSGDGEPPVRPLAATGSGRSR